MSCLFISLNYFIKLESDNHVRQIICDYLSRNFPLIEGIDTKEILDIEDPSGNYVNSMRHPCCMGGAIEIQAACNIWKLNIIVCNYRDRTSDIDFKPILDGGRILHTIKIYWTGNHYEPLV